MHKDINTSYEVSKFVWYVQVQGIDRLRVADASVMPSVTSGNTNAPVIMIAERVADFIKQRWLGVTAVSPFI